MLRFQSDQPASHRSDFKDEPESSGGCEEMLRQENPGAYLVTLVIIATLTLTFSAAMAATAVMAASAAVRAAMRTEGAAQPPRPKSAGTPSLGPGTESDVGIKVRRVTRRNRSRRSRKRDSDGMNRWSTPGAVRDVEQQTGEYGVDWDEWGPKPRVAEGADWEASAARASLSDAGSKDGTKGQQEGYVYPGRLPEEDAAWVEWFRENNIDIKNGVDIEAPPSAGSRDEDLSGVVVLPPE
jgi:hypothetical protein